jgi:hypothetical protein
VRILCNIAFIDNNARADLWGTLKIHIHYHHSDYIYVDFFLKFGCRAMLRKSVFVALILIRRPWLSSGQSSLRDADGRAPNIKSGNSVRGSQVSNFHQRILNRTFILHSFKVGATVKSA